jgi:hypothetical protein
MSLVGFNARRTARQVTRALTRTPTVGHPDHHVSRYAVFRRDVDTDRVTPWGWNQEESEIAESRGLKDNGSGFIKSRGFAEVEEQLDAEEIEPGTHVATVVVDLDEWDHRVEWEVDP